MSILQWSFLHPPLGKALPKLNSSNVRTRIPGTYNDKNAKHQNLPQKFLYCNFRLYSRYELDHTVLLSAADAMADAEVFPLAVCSCLEPRLQLC